jgi:hypothetical protein
MAGSVKQWTPEPIAVTLAAEIERLGFAPTTTRWCALGLRPRLYAVFAHVGAWRVAIVVVTPAAGDRMPTHVRATRS